MFALRLSFGWFETFQKGRPSVPSPLLQVTEVARVGALNLTKSGHIYRLALYDGTCSIHALLHPDIEYLVNELPPKTVIKLIQFRNISLSSGLYAWSRYFSHSSGPSLSFLVWRRSCVLPL